MDNDVAFLLKFLESGMKVLAVRMILIVTLLLTFSLFAWAMYLPDYWRVGCAAIFAVVVFLPILGLDKKGSQNAQTHT